MTRGGRPSKSKGEEPIRFRRSPGSPTGGARRELSPLGRGDWPAIFREGGIQKPEERGGRKGGWAIVPQET